MTWSPFFSDVTPGPTSITTPAPSWPKITGNKPSGSPPERVNSSVWQTPVALISTSTSPALGPSISTVSVVSGAPDFHATAALVCMGDPPCLRAVLRKLGFRRKPLPAGGLEHLAGGVGVEGGDGQADDEVGPGVARDQ